MTTLRPNPQNSERASESWWYSNLFGWTVTGFFPFLFLTIGCFSGYRAYTKDIGSIATTGVVVEFESTVRRIDKENRTLHRPIVSYGANDRTYRIKGDVWSVLPPYKIGERVVVRYKINEPELGTIDSFYERYFGAILFTGFGLFIVIAIVIGHVHSRQSDLRRGEIPQTP